MDKTMEKEGVACFKLLSESICL